MKIFFLKIASLIYEAAIRFRNKMFDFGIIKSHKFDIPIICVGNITVGGTGKTPTVEMLVKEFNESYNIAVLSRGYGRITKGYKVVTTDDDFLDVGDEPLQIKTKFPNITVVVCEKRVVGINNIKEQFPEVNLIIMDDGFQHRYVEPSISVIVLDATRKVYEDHLLPYGQLRDTLDQLDRAHYFIVAKCPDKMKQVEYAEWARRIKRIPYQKIYFSQTVVLNIKPLFDNSIPFTGKEDVIAVSGIGNNNLFVKGIKNRYHVIDEVLFDDHHRYKVQDLQRLNDLLVQHPGAIVVTTEKDAIKLTHSNKIPQKLRKALYYEPIQMQFIENPTSTLKYSKRDFINSVKEDIKNFDTKDGSYIRGC